MGRLAVAGGNSILGTAFASGGQRVDVDVEGGPVALLDCGDYVVLQRHGVHGYTNAAAIDHCAHVRALAAAGCDRILGLASVGALRRDLPVGTMLVPDDFVALHLGLSFSRGVGGHQVPRFDAEWRRQVVDTWKRATDVPVVDGGVYWQTIGPRFETPAEIRVIAAHADVVGMTIAAECILAGEVGVPYAAVCTVDNLANGVADRALTVAEFEAGKQANQVVLLETLDAVLPALGEMIA